MGFSSSTSSPSLSSSPQAHRKQWLEQSILRRLIDPVKTTIDAIRSVSPILNQTSPIDCAVFARHELQLNEIALGYGGFSAVHEIIGIRLDAAIHARCNDVQRQLRDQMTNNLYHAQTGKPRFVMKHLMRKLLSRPKVFQDALRDLALEVEYMGRISHQFILPLIARPVDGLDAVAQSYDGFFMITERLDQTLSQQIKDWNATSENRNDSDPASTIVDQRSVYLEQLAAAIAYLHERHIVFRDLKPDNIGIYQNQIRLFDFGLCREIPIPSGCHNNNSNNNSNNNNNDHLDQTFVMSGVGTQRYMAVELLENRPYNCKADVYSWALIAWEIMTGVKPYLRYGNAQHRFAVTQMNERPQLSKDWPQWLRSLLTTSWCRDISQRNTMALALSIIVQSRQQQAELTMVQQQRKILSKTTTTTTTTPTTTRMLFMRERPLRRISYNNTTAVENQSPLRISSVHWNMGLIFAS